MSVTHPLNKGDEVWNYVIEGWNNKLLAQPHLKHGVVTGGGDIRVHVTWDGERVHDVYSRWHLQNAVYATKREALEATRRRLEVIRSEAAARADVATTAIGVVLEALEAADLLPCGCPVDLPEVHQEGCMSAEAIAERQLERSLDEQQ